MTMKKPFVLCTLLLYYIFTGPFDCFAVTVFNDESAFISAAPIESTEVFDSVTQASKVITIDEVTYATMSDESMDTNWHQDHIGMRPDGTIDNANGTGLIHGDIDIETLSFGDGKFVRAIGFYLISGACCPTDDNLRIEFSLANGNTFEDSFTLRSDTDPTYRGYFSDVGIVSLTLDQPNQSTKTNWTYDNVSRSHVAPEPCSLWSIAMGFYLLTCWRQRGHRFQRFGCSCRCLVR